MLSTRITLLERFGPWSVIIPYFGTTDRSFLLLSQLSRKSRDMLDCYFEEVLNWMTANTTCLLVYSEDQGRIMLLPSCLFRFEITLDWEVLVNTFLILINNVNNKEGYYFNQHFMHSRLRIDSLKVNDALVKNLYPSLELLKTTEVVDYIVNIYFHFIIMNLK